ncbi:MAG: hypothetical protein JNK64_01565 [Myxococcales bacterium]|nr:hypothetical protein [Myxococcales bacterium]
MKTYLRARSIAVILGLGATAVAACGGDDGGGPMFADDHPRIYLQRNRDRLAAQVAANDPAWTRFKRIVDLQLDGSDIYAFQAWYAALVGKLTDDPRYCAAAVAQIDEFVSAEEAKIAAGERPDVAFDSYLEVGPLIGDLALTYDWCFDAASAGQRTRWITYANQAVWNVWHPDEATWGGTVMPWSGWSIDNPSNNYYYSFLRATMLLGIATRGETPEGQQWIDMFRDAKIGGQLQPTFARDLVGGGSREGTGYGVAMKNLFELYDFWQGSTGEALAASNGHARASMLHMMHSTVPTLDRIAPIGDHARDSEALWFDYHRHYLQTLAYLFADDPIAARATAFLADTSVPEMDQPFMYVYDFLYSGGITPTAYADLGRAYYAPGVGQLYARSGWTPTATWMSFIAGPYTESHAHQDQGSFMIFKGAWMGYDGNVDSADGLRQEPEAHSLIRFVDGGATVPQRADTTSQMAAVARGAGWVYAAGDLSAAFGAASPIDRWQREVVFLEPDVIVVYDRVATDPGVEQVWQLVAPAGFTVAGAAATSTHDGHALKVERLLPATATASAAALSGDFRGGFRYDERTTGTGHHLHVLSLDGAVTAATASGASGQDGVALTLADGRTATVRFAQAAIGGTLAIRGGGGDVDATLSAGVQALPERE